MTATGLPKDIRVKVKPYPAYYFSKTYRSNSLRSPAQARRAAWRGNH